MKVTAKKASILILAMVLLVSMVSTMTVSAWSVEDILDPPPNAEIVCREFNEDDYIDEDGEIIDPSTLKVGDLFCASWEWSNLGKGSIMEGLEGTFSYDPEYLMPVDWEGEPDEDSLCFVYNNDIYNKKVNKTGAFETDFEEMDVANGLLHYVCTKSLSVDNPFPATGDDGKYKMVQVRFKVLKEGDSKLQVGDPDYTPYPENPRTDIHIDYTAIGAVIQLDGICYDGTLGKPLCTTSHNSIVIGASATQEPTQEPATEAPTDAPKASIELGNGKKAVEPGRQAIYYLLTINANGTTVNKVVIGWTKGGVPGKYAHEYAPKMNGNVEVKMVAALDNIPDNELATIIGTNATVHYTFDGVDGTNSDSAETSYNTAQ